MMRAIGIDRVVVIGERCLFTCYCGDIVHMNGTNNVYQRDAVRSIQGVVDCGCGICHWACHFTPAGPVLRERGVPEGYHGNSE